MLRNICLTKKCVYSDFENITHCCYNGFEEDIYIYNIYIYIIYIYIYMYIYMRCRLRQYFQYFYDKLQLKVYIPTYKRKTLIRFIDSVMTCS